MPEVLKISQFPMRKLFNTTQLLNFRAAVQSLPRGAEYQARLDAIIGAFTEYRLPVVTLRDLSVEEVCPIFERINSSGTKLSTYDLMVAATWNREFDLNDEVDEIRDALDPKGFSDIDRETVLKCLSAVHLGTIKERSLMTLRTLSKDNIKTLIDTTKEALLRTVDLLSTEFNIYSWDFLSYEALAVIVCYIYAKISHLSSDQVCRVRQWFWRASFGERYKVGGENFVSNDLMVVYKYVLEGEGSASDFGEPPGEREWQAIPFRSNVSRSRAYVLALAARRPRNLTNGAHVDPTVALSSYNKKEFHHVYPRAHLKRRHERINDNLLLNICMLSAAGNKAISDSDPQAYLPQYAVSLGQNANSVFSSNLLPKPTEFNTTGEYAEFLTARAIIVAQFVQQLCDGDAPDARS